MRFGVFLPHFGPHASPEAFLEVAQAAEQLGWDSAWWGDHVIIPGANTNRFGATFYETLTSMGWVAARTRRIRLGSSVVLLPYRHPLMLAKQMATMDQLSGGRMILGAAAGWLKEEFDILALPFEARGRVADECLQVIRACWQDAAPNFEGEFFQVRDIAFAPKPLQTPLPIWVGGNSRAALRRAVRFGDGWDPISSVNSRMSFEALEAMLGLLRKQAQAEKRALEGFTVSFHAQLRFDIEPGGFADTIHFIGPVEDVVARIQRAEALGVDNLILNCFYKVPDQMEFDTIANTIKVMERFSAEVLPHFPV